MIPRLMVIGLCLTGGCAGIRGETMVPFERPDAAQYLSAARSHASSGRSLEASLYFEAALATGGDPREILPELCLAQAQAGRLRDAQRRLTQLLALRPSDRGARELSVALAALLEAPTNAPVQEMP